jgi:hypothetical protein
MATFSEATAFPLAIVQRTLTSRTYFINIESWLMTNAMLTSTYVTQIKGIIASHFSSQETQGDASVGLPISPIECH